ncbi:hypothetical protein CDAR_95851 [Caerostris darwini]|uniref:Uncharacterized protein n=1 Tax=Caerostris darwini TaxID=1538125 RepID=A0AAV4UQA6_9ARAC|nr:hypothetical protein CDAR_95851 [Caerostris darwini]
MTEDRLVTDLDSPSSPPIPNQIAGPYQKLSSIEKELGVQFLTSRGLPSSSGPDNQPSMEEMDNRASITLIAAVNQSTSSLEKRQGKKRANEDGFHFASPYKFTLFCQELLPPYPLFPVWSNGLKRPQKLRKDHVKILCISLEFELYSRAKSIFYQRQQTFFRLLPITQ